MSAATQNTFHQEILAELKKHSGRGTSHSGNVAYLGNSHFSYHISNPVSKTIAKEFFKKRRDISLSEFVELLNALYASRSYDEKAMASSLISYYETHRARLDPALLNLWLEHLEGWAEIDSLCQSNFTAEELLSKWSVWKKLLVRFSKDSAIAKRRASLVLLTGAVSKSADPRLLELSFTNIDRLKSEKDILITKAISWLLRSLVKHHKKEVAAYIEQNLTTLPKIAIREARRKILTGRK